MPVPCASAASSRGARQTPDIYAPTSRATKRLAHITLERRKSKVLDITRREPQKPLTQRETQAAKTTTQGRNAIVAVVHIDMSGGSQVHAVLVHEVLIARGL